MQPNLKKILRTLTLEIRHTLEGTYDASGTPHPGDLETRLNELGVWRKRDAKPLEELPHLSAEDKAARQVIDAYIAYRAEAEVNRADAVAEFVREAAYNWANRLLALRCMEARGIIDEVILQKEVYGGRSMVHNRLAKKNPSACAGPDEGLFTVLIMEFEERAKELPELFAPTSPAIALRPSLPALKHCIALLSGKERANGQEEATDLVFCSQDALGWAYQYWNTEEKDRIFEKVRTQKGAKIEGADIIPATQLYTEPYMVKFLVQNSLGALWMGMHPESTLSESWEYYVKDADRTPVELKSVKEITLLDPACGSGHFLVDAFDLFFEMYLEELAGETGKERASLLTDHTSCITASILNHNLYGIDIDERAVQIAAAVMWMKAKEVAPDLKPEILTNFHQHLVATNICLSKEKNHLKTFLAKHPEAVPLQLALETVFEGLENVHELGSLVQIEEPVEKELRNLRDKYERVRKRGVQAGLFEPMVVQGELPLNLESYDQWKARTLTDLEQHFMEENEASDASQAFFGQSAFKGIVMLDLLTRNYDVVTANPPWMGSKNMGLLTYSYLSSRYAEGKRDVYAAFILRCFQLCIKSGYIAMITQQSWLFLKTFSRLRLNPESETTRFKGVLLDTNIESLVHLGRYAFSELGNAVIQPVLFILRKNQLNEKHRMYTIRLKAPRLAEEQAEKIRVSAKKRIERMVSIIQQIRFLNIPDSPVVYWLPESYLRLPISTNRRSVDLFISKGIDSCNQTRFMRFIWEINNNERFWLYAKGGTHCKWFGLNMYVIDWEMNGARIKNFLMERHPIDKLTLLIQHEAMYGEENLTYSAIAQGAMGARYNGNGLFSGSGPGIFWRGAGNIQIVLCILNTRLSSFLLRGLTAGGLSFFRAYVEKCPVTSEFVSKWESEFGKELPNKLIKAKEWLTSHDIREKSYSIWNISASTLKDICLKAILAEYSVIGSILELEGANEKHAFSFFKIPENDIVNTIEETGTPAGWFPLIHGYENIPQYSISETYEITKPVTFFLNKQTNPDLALGNKVSALKEKLKLIFGVGPGLKDAVENENEDNSFAQEEDSTVGAFIPIPCTSFLEEISLSLQIHPYSVFWLLKEGIEEEGWRCPQEERRITEDIFTALILRMLGHRWPKQIEVGEPVPDWADPDGIIPLTTGLQDEAFLERVLGRLPEEFPGGNASALEREFKEIMGESLENWLNSSFFKHHISQFKKRPIAWQLQSQPVPKRASSRTRKVPATLSKAPAFSCIVYFQKLNPDTLTAIISQYARPLREGFETELRTLENLALLTDDQRERLYQLGAWIEELEDFEKRLETVAQEGFGSEMLTQIAFHEPLDVWTSRDGQVASPQFSDAFRQQEARYDPDINDGVRVNIAPLQKAGLLAADVLDAKDVEKAIADRAEWRADERRWCREGKLPKSGWWK